MLRILHIDSSPRGQRSHSRRLSAELVAALSGRPESSVKYRDLGRQAIPPIDETWIAAAFSPTDQRTPEMQEALRLSDELIDELLEADALVIGTPMFNFGIPANLKAWIDQVIRVGRTFTVPSFEGLAKGKKAFIVLAAGQEYGPGSPMQSMNHAIPQLKAALGFIGITDVTVIPVATNAGEETLDRTTRAARALFQGDAGTVLSAAA